MLLIALAYPAWRFLPAHGSVTPDAGAANKTPAIPVTTQVVQQADFPVYLNGLGTVQPYDTVIVRSRVDGQVIKVAFTQGQMVKEGDLLVQIDPRPYQAALDQAQAKKAQDEANLRNAELDLQRYSTLAKSDFASRQQLDTQQATVNQLTAQIKGDQAAIDNAQTQLDYTTIRSPLSGKTGFRQVDPGNIVHASDTTGIVSIVKLQPISVVFTAPEEDLQQINQALSASKVPVTALSSNSSRFLANGHLALVNNQIDQASGTIQMKATFANEDNALWPGLSVATRLLVTTRKNVAVVPNDAIQHGPNGLYAFVVGQDNKVSVRNITVGDEGTTQTVVTQGLAAGDHVVVAGQYRLTPGALVDARAAAGGSPPANEQANNGEHKVH
ncbi:efflux RND transporter periplasmic adaptor subunit [Microbacteriaceae bacterium K1510]|nr:efflux RND transporter periplasmic adaptor subunit [Microbacteriaceae bacterium K1510]